jgi:hypothetical protein
VGVFTVHNNSRHPSVKSQYGQWGWRKPYNGKGMMNRACTTSTVPIEGLG